MPNLQNNIKTHNKKILQQQEINTTESMCNCRKKDSCPLKGKCLSKCVVYKATVKENDNTTETYIGLTENEFKTRYNQHTSSFRLSHKRSSTTLSEHVWKLKEKNSDFTVQWDIVTQCAPMGPDDSFCAVCREEKFQILQQTPTLDRRSECFTHCRHKRKFGLGSCQGRPPDPTNYLKN